MKNIIIINFDSSLQLINSNCIFYPLRFGSRNSACQKQHIIISWCEYFKYIYIYMCVCVCVCVCMCVCVCVCIRGAFNKFPDFFVQAFKIVVNSWKFSMLLLHIIWDDWPIFMISGSTEQLQQQLEYTLLKPDCHSWWISKMQSGREEERYAIKLSFKLGKNAREAYRMLQTAFRPSCMNRASVFEWHERFMEGRESVSDDESCARSKQVNRPELIGQRVRVRVTMLRF